MADDNDKTNIMAQLIQRKAQLEKAIEPLEKALAKVNNKILEIEEKERASKPNRFAKSWERRLEIYELISQGLSFAEIARRQKRSRKDVEHDFWKYEQKYAPLCLVTVKTTDRQWTSIYRHWSRERAEQGWRQQAQILAFEQYQPLIWDSFYHDGGSHTECGNYEIVREGHTGAYSDYFAIHLPSEWESPIYSGSHSPRHERTWIISYDGEDVEISDWGIGREGAKNAAEIHAVSIWAKAGLQLVSDHIRRWDERLKKWV